MKSVQILFGITIVFFNASVFGCQSSAIEYRSACMDDVQGIVSLVNEYGAKDNDKIVILPKLFRLKATESAIAKNRIFVACNKTDNMVVAYKKLFLLSDAQECLEMLEQEIRCTGSQSELVDSAFFANTDQYAARHITDTSSLEYNDSDAYIYNGADFTHPDFRGKGINTQLTDRALALIKEETCKHICEKQAKQLIMLYGLTQSNDYDFEGNSGSRTPSIVRSFASFIRASIPSVGSDVMLLRHNRYKAFMPTFDPNATECRPLLDDQSVSGYGNVLSYSITQK